MADIDVSIQVNNLFTCKNVLLFSVFKNQIPKNAPTIINYVPRYIFTRAVDFFNKIYLFAKHYVIYPFLICLIPFE